MSGTDYAITGLPAGTPSGGDWVPFVKVSDTTTAPAGPGGSDQRTTVADLVLPFAIAMGG